MKEIINTLETVNHWMKESGIEGSITFRGETSHMVRCGRSQISLNVSETGKKFFVELQKGKQKIAGSTTCLPTDFSKLQSFVAKLNENLAVMPEIAHLTPMMPIASNDHNTLDYDRELEVINSSMMVDLFKQVDDYFGDLHCEVSGAFSAGSYAYAIINTLVDEPVFYQGADYNVEVVVQLLNDSKKEIRVADIGEELQCFRPENIVNELKNLYAVKKETQRIDLAAGKYDVVFGAPAFGEMAAYMSYLTFSGETFEYQFGMLKKGEHEIGEKIFSDKLTIIDAPHRSDSLFKRPIGMNGIFRPDTELVKNGVLMSMHYSDKGVCDRFNKTVNNDSSVMGLNIQRGDGPEDFDTMVQSCQRPTIYIPFIHYMNFTNAVKGEFTGTSRFGTFLMENGKIVNHLYNLRINDSYFNIFNNIDWLSQATAHINTADTYGLRNAGSVACPKFVKINGVNISGSNAPSAK